MLKFVRNRNWNFINSFLFLKQQKKSIKASVTNFFSHKVGQNWGILSAVQFMTNTLSSIICGYNL